MKKRSKLLIMLTAILGASASVATAWTGLESHSKLATNEDLKSPILIEKGKYLATIGDCTSCHTLNTSQPFAGGVPFELPMGTIYAPNISPDITDGIGSYSLKNFDDAVRYGIRKDGKSLYPAMPYPDYAVIKDEDIVALYAYFMNGVKAQAVPNHKSDISFPLSIRGPVTAWRELYSEKVGSFDDIHYKDKEVEQGAYLVQGLGHCGSCHTPRGIAINEKGYNETDPHFLSGAKKPIDGWLPVNLRGDNLTGLGQFSVEEIAELLMIGKNRHSAVFGGMTEVIENSLQYLTDEDALAMAKYLKSLTPVDAKNPPYVYDPATHNALKSGNDSAQGAAIYLDNCAACHRTYGQGYPRVFPALAGNPVLMSDNPVSIINLIAQGGTAEGTTHSPSSFTMPDEFKTRLTDKEIANVVTFIRTSWGNQGKPVTERDVSKVLKN